MLMISIKLFNLFFLIPLPSILYLSILSHSFKCFLLFLSFLYFILFRINGLPNILFLKLFHHIGFNHYCYLKFFLKIIIKNKNN